MESSVCEREGTWWSGGKLVFLRRNHCLSFPQVIYEVSQFLKGITQQYYAGVHITLCSMRRKRRKGWESQHALWLILLSSTLKLTIGLHCIRFPKVWTWSSSTLKNKTFGLLLGNKESASSTRMLHDGRDFRPCCSLTYPRLQEQWPAHCRHSIYICEMN